MQTITCILSDVHNVAILWDPQTITELEKEYGLEPGYIMATAFDSDIGRAATVGEITDEEWSLKLASHLPGSLLRRWLADYGEVNAMYVAYLLQSKKDGKRIGFITNATSRLERHLRHHSLLDIPDFIVASYREGLAKPDRKIFKEAISRAGVRPDAILYIDDDPRFVAAGKAEGMHTMRYTCFEQLQLEIAALDPRLGLVYRQ